MGKRIQGSRIVIIVISCTLVLCGAIYLWYAGVWLDNWEHKTLDYDLEKDGTCETIVLKNRTMQVFSQEEIIWESEQQWKISDFLIGDINRDGCDEILMLVWKHGSYGDYTPFWDENDNGFSQHIFIFQWIDERLDPIWMSSTLRPQVDSWELTDENTIRIIIDSGEDTRWIWGQWGLERIK